MSDKKPNSPNYEKLPLWAQREIATLKMREQELLRRLDQFTGEEKTNTYIVDGLDKKPLPRYASVKFYTDTGEYNSVTVMLRGDGSIEINSDSRLGHTFVVLPRASNSLYVGFVKL